jgi:fumarate reductase flavoprotein subunit
MNHTIYAALLGALALGLFLGGCENTSGPEPSGPAYRSYQPGSYQGSAQGRNAALPLTTVFSQAAIDSITIDSHEETLSMTEVVQALTDIPAAIIERQRLDVDAVSQATITSNAIKNAVRDCVIAAGENPAALGAP